MAEKILQIVIQGAATLAALAIPGLIWLYYAFKNHQKNYELDKIALNERLIDKLNIERLTTEKEALRMKEDYSEKITKITVELNHFGSTMSSYIKRSVEVDEEQTKSINDLRNLIIEKLLNEKVGKGGG